MAHRKPYTDNFADLVARLNKMSNITPEQERKSLLESASAEPRLLDEKDVSLADIAKLAGIKEYIEPVKVSKKAKKLVFEIDMSQAMIVSMKMLAMAPMKDNKKLSDLLSEDDYNLVKNYFTKETESAELKVLPFSRIENWKPMLLQSFLYQDMIEGPVKAYEMELLSIGQKQKKSFGGLETIEDQIAVFEKIPYSDQAKALVEMIQEIKSGSDKSKNQFKELIAIYKLEDVDGMVEMSSEQFDDMENGQEELLTKRNNKWIPKIAAMSKKESTFYAVGAAHLGGPDGVLRLLMKEGYTVKPLK